MTLRTNTPREATALAEGVDGRLKRISNLISQFNEEIDQLDRLQNMLREAHGRLERGLQIIENDTKLIQAVVKTNRPIEQEEKVASLVTRVEHELNTLTKLGQNERDNIKPVA